MLTVIGIRFPIAFLAIAICCSATIAHGGDPNVRTASHEAVGEEIPDVTPEQNVTSQRDTLSYSPQWPEPPNTGAMLMRLCFGTVAVLGLCVASLWLGKPWLKRLQIAGVGNASMSVEGTVALGNRAMLYLVRVGDTQLVAGTDAAGLKSLIAIPASFKEVLDDQIPQIAAVDPSPIGAIEINDFSARGPE